jgi:hypothetical protein
VIQPRHESTPPAFDCYRLDVTWIIDHFRHGDSCLIVHSGDKGNTRHQTLQTVERSATSYLISSLTAGKSQTSSLKVALPCFHLHHSQTLTSAPLPFPTIFTCFHVQSLRLPFHEQSFAGSGH